MIPQERMTYEQARHMEACNLVAILYEEMKEKGIVTRGTLMASHFLWSVGYKKAQSQIKK